MAPYAYGHVLTHPHEGWRCCHQTDDHRWIRWFQQYQTSCLDCLPSTNIWWLDVVVFTCFSYLEILLRSSEATVAGEEHGHGFKQAQSGLTNIISYIYICTYIYIYACLNCRWCFVLQSCLKWAVGRKTKYQGLRNWCWNCLKLALTLCSISGLSLGEITAWWLQEISPYMSIHSAKTYPRHSLTFNKLMLLWPLTCTNIKTSKLDQKNIAVLLLFLFLLFELAFLLAKAFKMHVEFKWSAATWVGNTLSSEPALPSKENGSQSKPERLVLAPYKPRCSCQESPSARFKDPQCHPGSTHRNRVCQSWPWLIGPRRVPPAGWINCTCSNPGWKRKKTTGFRTSKVSRIQLAVFCQSGRSRNSLRLYILTLDTSCNLIYVYLCNLLIAFQCFQYDHPGATLPGSSRQPSCPSGMWTYVDLVPGQCLCVSIVMSQKLTAKLNSTSIPDALRSDLNPVKA